MSISLQEAKATLKAMFEGFDEEVLVAVLRAERGHLENTIDALLRMSAEAEGLIPPEQTQTQTHVHTSTPPHNAAPVSHTSSLPSDFLTIPTAAPVYSHNPPAPLRRPADSSSEFWAARPDEEQQVISDEQYARMLQDELFMRELRANQAMAHAFGYHEGAPVGAVPSNRPQTISEFRQRVESSNPAPEKKGMFQSFVDKFFTPSSRTGYQTVKAEDDDNDGEEGEFTNVAASAANVHRRQPRANEDDDFDRSLGDTEMTVFPRRAEAESKKDD